MKHYYIRLSFKSDRTVEQITKYFEMVEKGLKLISPAKIVIETRQPSGADATQYRRVQNWVKRRTVQSEFTTADVANALNMNRSSAWRILQRMIMAGEVTSQTYTKSFGVIRRYSKAKKQRGAGETAG